MRNGQPGPWDGPGLGWYSTVTAAISGDYVVVGDHANPENGTDAGAADIFHRVGSNWQYLTRIIGSDVGFESTFGLTLAIDGDWMVVGAPQHPFGSAGKGSAYIYQLQGNAWVERQKLETGGTQDELFADTLAMSGDAIVIGAPVQDVLTGRVYVYRRSGDQWLPEASFIGNDTVSGDYFGQIVAVSGDRLVVGENLPGVVGSAYVFHYDGSNWTQEAKLTASDGVASDLFGDAVTIDGNFIAVGARADSDGGTNSGSAYVFRLAQGQWTQEAKLTASDARANDGFGASLGLRGPWLLIGSQTKGAIYLFENNLGTWSQQSEFIAHGAMAGSVFWTSIPFDGSEAAIVSGPVTVYAVPNGPPCIPALGASELVVFAIVIAFGGVIILCTRRHRASTDCVI
ncbi:MAG: FG-GAP repeat protein [Planctomycetes bacterium]|nr:FG-GAP repeat protein [Planctomycetota bacterium]